ncbi:hypothetical protein ACFWAP_00495 [Streptomyces goshikiensis]|uniref:hypothetical protein n=1 Tax=Streptomyces goshikiensis TaxID=1942 RepID=UPI00365BE04E
MEEPMGVREARANFADLMNRVQIDREHIPVVRNSRVAFIAVPEDWYERAVAALEAQGQAAGGS